jgi:hypothetical protein
LIKKNGSDNIDIKLEKAKDLLPDLVPGWIPGWTRKALPNKYIEVPFKNFIKDFKKD